VKYLIVPLWPRRGTVPPGFLALEQSPGTLAHLWCWDYERSSRHCCSIGQS